MAGPSAPPSGTANGVSRATEQAAIRLVSAELWFELDPARRTLTARARLGVRATATVPRLLLDLDSNYTVRSVTVDGRALPATSVQRPDGQLALAVPLAKGAVAAVYRQIPERVRTFEELGLPSVIATLSERPRGLVLVTGPTGSGKSTLASLVPRLHDVTSGRVSIDGVDVRELALTDLASLVGVVTQETYLMHASVRDNLRHARPDATDAEIEEACRQARIHELISSLPEGYDTLVGSRGHRFSGGEKQRLAIARTLLRDPKVLVLDEATSALDNDTERELQRALDALSAGRTTITTTESDTMPLVAPAFQSSATSPALTSRVTSPSSEKFT